MLAMADVTGALRGVGSGRCLDVPNSSQTDETYLQMRGRADGFASQSHHGNGCDDGSD